MEVINERTSTAMREDKTLLVLTHLSQLLYYVTGFGGLLVPLVIWLATRDRVLNMNEHGKAIVNFQLTLILLFILSIPGIFLFGLGILVMIAIGIVGFILPIVNAIRANNNEPPSYFMTIRFIS